MLCQAERRYFFMNTQITVSFACANSAMAAKMIEYFDRINAECAEQLSDSLRNHPQEWVEFGPDGSSRPATEPVNMVPPHVAHPGASAVPPTAAGSAPVPYQMAAPQQPQAPMQPAGQPVPPMPQGAPMPQTAPMPQPAAAAPMPQPPAPPTPAQIPPAAPAPQPAAYQQTAMTYTPAPNNVPSPAPTIRKEQLQNAMQLFASSSQARSVQIRDLLARFGVNSFDGLPEASYPEFTNSLRGMGVAI